MTEAGENIRHALKQKEQMVIKLQLKHFILVILSANQSEYSTDENTEIKIQSRILSTRYRDVPVHRSLCQGVSLVVPFNGLLLSYYAQVDLLIIRYFCKTSTQPTLSLLI